MEIIPAARGRYAVMLPPGSHMQIIFLLIEIFLPEIAQKLAGRNSDQLRSKLVRSGLRLLILASLIFGWLLFSHRVLKRLPWNQFNPFELPMFTVWLLAATGLSLLSLSRYEYPQKTQEDNNQSALVNNPQKLQLKAYAESVPNFHQGIIKVKAIKFQDCLNGVVPNEAWGFWVGDQYCKLVNNSVTGSALYVNNKLVAKDNVKMQFGSARQERLRVIISDSVGGNYDIAIFFRAWLHIRIRVAVNGKYISDKFV